MSNPVVSICVPLYNGGHFIGATIESVRCQTYANWEMIVMDDGSTDDSGSLVRQYADSRIRYHQNAVQIGMQGNFNRLLEFAHGKYIKLLCQDDLLHPDCLRRQVDIMDKPGNERVVLVTCASEIIDARGKIFFRRRWHKSDLRVPGLIAIKQTVRAGTNLIGEPSSVLFRTSERDRCGGFDERFPYAIDLDYWIRLLSAGDCYYLAQPLCQFRVSRYSASFHMSGRQDSQFIAYAMLLRHNSALRLSKGDVVSGMLRAHLRALLRQFIYWIFWRRLGLS